MSNRDVVDELQDALTQSSSRREGTDHSETNGDLVAVPRCAVEAAVAEIAQLRKNMPERRLHEADVAGVISIDTSYPAISDRPEIGS